MPLTLPVSGERFVGFYFLTQKLDMFQMHPQRLFGPLIASFLLNRSMVLISASFTSPFLKVLRS